MKKVVISLIGALLLGVVIFYLAFFVLSVGDRYLLAQNPIGYRVLAAWHSIRKIPNLVHFPYWFRDTELEEYYLSISTTNMIEMNDHKPIIKNGLAYGKMSDQYKYYVNADFYAPDSEFNSKVKIRYRGTNNNNWDAEKAAYRIKFKKDNLFEGQRGLNLFLPYDRGFFSEMIDWYRANKLGLFTTDFKFVRVYLNGRDLGVYLASEPWSKELLGRKGLVDTNNIFSNSDNYESENKGGLFSDQGLAKWKSYTAVVEKDEFFELDTLIKVLNQASDDEFEEMIESLVDLEKVYAWQALNVLAASSHQTDSNNTVLLFRKESGKFEPVPWDVSMSEADKYQLVKTNTLVKRILSREKFFTDFQAFLGNYAFDEKNLEDDLEYYDSLYATMRREFFNDQAKLYNDFMFEKAIAKHRQLIVDNFTNAKKIAKRKESPYFYEFSKDGADIEFKDSFQYFDKIFLGVDDFLQENKQFKKIDDSNIILRRGKHLFQKTVIVPKKLKLTIEPGAEILFAKGISLITYGPVNAKGDHGRKIVMQGSDKLDPWGVFAVINAKEESVFEHIVVKNGSSDTANGVFFTSQFSLHNVRAKVANSRFENSQSDDAFHAILGSVDIQNSIFKNSMSDGVDVDYVSNSKITDCQFINEKKGGNNGDAIDVSGVSNFILSGNLVRGYGDKCLSVGEKSILQVKNNIFDSCVFGIAVKDASRAILENNFIMNNSQAGLALYRKKPEFVTGGSTEIRSAVMCGNGKNTGHDDLSSLQGKELIALVESKEGGCAEELRGVMASRLPEELSKKYFE